MKGRNGDGEGEKKKMKGRVSSCQEAPGPSDRLGAIGRPTFAEAGMKP
jgi:hypothetical protein